MTAATLPVSSWLAPARGALDTYRRTSDHMLDVALPFESFASSEPSREFARLANRSARARAGVLREWSLAPLWLSGLASPSDLFAEIENATAIDRDLSEAWRDLVRSQVNELSREVQATAAAVLPGVPGADLNALAVDAVRTAAMTIRAAGHAGSLNAAAVEAVRIAASTARLARQAQENAAETLEVTADLVLAGAEAATGVVTAEDDGVPMPKSGILEQTGDSQEFVPATLSSAAD